MTYSWVAPSTSTERKLDMIGLSFQLIIFCVFVEPNRSPPKNEALGIVQNPSSNVKRFFARFRTKSINLWRSRYAAFRSQKKYFVIITTANAARCEFEIKIFHANCAFVVTWLRSVSNEHSIFLLLSLAFQHLAKNKNCALKMLCCDDKCIFLLPITAKRHKIYDFLLPRFGEQQEIIRNNNYYKATKCLAL